MQQLWQNTLAKNTSSFNNVPLDDALTALKTDKNAFLKDFNKPVM